MFYHFALILGPICRNIKIVAYMYMYMYMLHACYMHVKGRSAWM